MNSQCGDCQGLIPRSFVGDLNAQEQEILECHLANCVPCCEERDRYAETLQALQMVEDEPAPRHFFVYPQNHRAGLWDLFRQLTPVWRAAGATAVAAILMIGLAAASSLQIRSDQGAWSLSFGPTTVSSPVDVAALKADILRTAEERNRANAIGWIQNLRSEVGARSELSQQQQMQLVTALENLETRLNNRITNTAEDIKAGTMRANVELYQTVSLQREQDVHRINTRLDNVVEAHETKSRQTDEILDTLLQIVTNLKNPGELK